MADPFSELDAAPREVQERIADPMDARCFDPAQIEMRRRYLARLSLPVGAGAVEFGSGTGHLTRDLIEVAGAAEALGIEPSRAMIERAQVHHADMPGLGFQVGGAEATGLPDRSVDLVVMHTLICHAPEAGSIVA